MSRCSGRSPRQALLCPLSEPSWWAGPFPEEGDQSRQGSGNQAQPGHVEGKGNVCWGRDDVNAAVRHLKGCCGKDRWLESDWLNANYGRGLRNPIKHTVYKRGKWGQESDTFLVSHNWLVIELGQEHWPWTIPKYGHPSGCKLYPRWGEGGWWLLFSVEAETECP